jgi:hypothetical protein
VERSTEGSSSSVAVSISPSSDTRQVGRASIAQNALSPGNCVSSHAVLGDEGNGLMAQCAPSVGNGESCAENGGKSAKVRHAG